MREPIRASWRRSIASGLSPDRLDVPFDADVDRDGPLARAARLVLDQLAGELAGTGVAVVLADAAGRVVDRRVSEPWLAAQLDRLLLAPGYVYAEDAVGTNGIGTALAQRSPLIVEGPEHFADALAALTCAAAPITDPGTGHIGGALDLTCLASVSSPLMLPLATRAAGEIESRLADDAGLPERLVLHRFLQTRQGAKGPFVLLTDRWMIANAAADHLVRPDDEPALRRAAGRLGAGATHGSDDVVDLVLGRRITVSVRAEPIAVAGSHPAIVLRLTPVAPAGAAAGAGGWEDLTETERSVAALVALGLTNREAGERLFLSRHTVGFHLRSIFRKLGTSSRVELARLAVEGGPSWGTGETLTSLRSSVDTAVPRFGA